MLYECSDDIYKDIAEVTQTRFDTSNEVDLCLKEKQIIGLMKDELGGKSCQNLLDYEQKLIVT